MSGLIFILGGRKMKREFKHIVDSKEFKVTYDESAMLETAGELMTCFSPDYFVFIHNQDEYATQDEYEADVEELIDNIRAVAQPASLIDIIENFPRKADGTFCNGCVYDYHICKYGTYVDGANCVKSHRIKFKAISDTELELMLRVGLMAV